MAWKYIEYRYPTEYQIEKILTWSDSNFRCYFALKQKHSDSWSYYSGNASHTLATGEKLVLQSSEGDAQTDYWLAQPDSSNKTIALLPNTKLFRYVRIYVDDANDAPTQIYEFRPSARLSADEIVTGDLKITDDFSSPPTITVTASAVDRVKIGKISSSYGIAGYDSNAATVFELTDDKKQIAGWDFNATKLSKNNAEIKSTGKIKLGSGNDVVELDSQDGTYRLWVGHDNAASAPFRVTKSGNLVADSGTFTGTLAASSINTRELAANAVNAGIIAANAVEASTIKTSAITTDKIDTGAVTADKISVASLEALAINTGHLSVNATIGVGTGLLIDGLQNRIRAESGSNYVEMTASWLKGYDSVLGQTFILPTNGSAPEFSSGKIKEVEYIVWNTGVLKVGSGSSEASIDPETSGGLIVNKEAMTGYNQNGDKRFQVIYAGTDQGDVEIGKYSSDKGIKWDQSASTLNVKGTITVTGGSGIANLSDAGNLAVEDTISSSLIDSSAVTTTKIEGGAITTGKLAALAVEAGKIAANAVEASTIKSSAVTADKIAANAVEASKLNVDELSAITASLGQVVIHSTGHVRSSTKDDYSSTAAGFFLGYDTDDYKLNIGDEVSSFKWDGDFIVTKFRDVEMSSNANPDISSMVASCSSKTTGSVPSGFHDYYVSFITSEGEHSPSISYERNFFLDSTATHTITLHDIPIGTEKVIARKIYRKTRPYPFTDHVYPIKTLTTINDNTSTSFVDTKDLSELGTNLTLSDKLGGRFLVNGSTVVVSAGENLTTLGLDAFGKATGMKIVALGYKAGYNASNSDESVFIGNKAGQDTIGRHDRSVMLGYLAGYQSTAYSSSNTRNVYLGALAGSNNKGIVNVAVGPQTLSYADGDNNVAVGYNVGAYASANYLTSVGYYSGYRSNNASYDVYLGAYSGYQASGYGNIYLGYEAGREKSENNMLRITTNNASDLVVGDFANASLTINGDLTVSGKADITATLSSGTITADKLLFSSSTEVTIASRQITVTRSHHQVDTESDAASDILATINGGVNNMLLILRTKAWNRQIRIKDQVGNLYLAKSDFVLNSGQDRILLMYTTPHWYEISRSDN